MPADNNSSSRKNGDIQKKIKEALARKGTKGTFGVNAESIYITPKSANKQIAQHTIRGVKRINFKRNTPITMGVNFVPMPFKSPNHVEYKMPSWFSTAESTDIDVSIIVPCFKSKDHIVKQINSWDIDCDGLKCEIIYVDDCCPYKTHLEISRVWDTKKDSLKSPIGRIILVNGKNGGFSFAFNLGASYAKGKYLVFLNADTTVTKNWIKPMLDVFSAHKNVGIVGNLHLKNNNTIDSCGSEWDWKMNCFLHIGKHIYKKKNIGRAFDLKDAPEDILKTREVEMVTGACFMMPKQAFTQVGGFDLEYRVGYWEDADICMKAHANGYKVMFTSESRIYHEGGHTNSAGHNYIGQNKMLFYKKWISTKIFQGYLNENRPIDKEIIVDPNKIVVYTAITNVSNNYDDLKEQKKKEDEVQFVAFLENPTTSNTWECRKIHTEFKDPNRNAKIHKILPHVYFPEKNYSLWIDGSVKIKFPFSLKRLVEIYLCDCDMAVFKHSERTCIYQEANVCIKRRLDDAEVIRKQISKYTKDGYASNLGLAECTIILRRHSSEIKTFNEAWWKEICEGSKRDQISFNYVAKKLGIRFKYFSGNLRQENYLFTRDNHKTHKKI